ncbi:MAG: hypothetical protein WBM04_05845 [Candidatus Korobacteraceae bacterium]
MKRFLAVFLMALGFFVFLNAVEANAKPIRPATRSVISPSAQQPVAPDSNNARKK